MRKTWLTLALSAALAVTAVPCFAEADAARSDIRIGMPGDVASLLPNTTADTNTFQYIHNILYEPLVAQDAEGEYIGVLATDWENPDDSTWVFHLREDVRFQNGDPFNADAVKYTFDLVQSEEDSAFFAAKIAKVQDVEVVDDYTVKLTTDGPYAELLSNLVYIQIEDPAYIEEVGLDGAAETPNGTGVYKLDEWKKDEYVKLSVNEDYWGGQPEITEVTFRTYPEASARLSAFLAGEIDVFANVPVDSIPQVEGSGKGSIVSKITARNFYLVLNTFYEGPVQNQLIRQALNYAVDQQEIIDHIYNGYETELKGILASNHYLYSPAESYEYDPDKALELIAEAGYAPEDLDIEILVQTDYEVTAQAIQAQLQKIGIKASVNTQQRSDYLTTVRERSAKDSYIMSWGPIFEPATVFQGLFYSTASYGGFNDEQADRLIDAAVAAFENGDRESAYEELQTYLADQAVAVPLWTQNGIYAVADGLTFEGRIDEAFWPQSYSWNA